MEARLLIARENAALQKRSLDITELLFNSGNDSELDVQQAKAQYLGTLSTIPPLEGSLRQTQNALSTLLARAPGPLPEMAAGKDVIPQAQLAVIVDMPADLLRRRPDVRAAEMQLAAQSALIGVSVADLYPSISLLGSLGLSAISLGGWTRALSLGGGPSLVRNVFDHGRLTNQVLLQDARFQQLHAQYQDAVLQAAREVDDAAVGFAKTGEEIALLADAVKAARRSLDIATIQYREGLIDFQRVLDSQRTLFNQQERLVLSQGNLTQNLIALYKAMGGGWEQGRSRPVLDEETGETMGKRSDWENLLAAPLPAPGADAPPNPPGRRRHHESRTRKTETRPRLRLAITSPPPPRHAVPHRRSKPGKGTRVGAIIVLILIVGKPGLVFRFGSPDPVHLPGQGPGIRCASGSPGSGHSGEGARQEQR